MSDHDAGVDVALLAVSPSTELVRRLRDGGMAPHLVQVGEVRDRPDDEVRAGVGDLAGFAWVAVTSANAARRLGLFAPWPEAVRVGAVGPATADAVRAAGAPCTVSAVGGTGRDLADELDDGPVLFLAAGSARDGLPDALRERSMVVKTVVAYDVEARPLDDDGLRAIERSAAAVAMTPLAIEAISELAPDDRARVSGVPLVSIGPTTSQRARELGVDVAAEAVGRDADALLGALRAVLDGTSAR